MLQSWQTKAYDAGQEASEWPPQMKRAALTSQIKQ